MRLKLSILGLATTMALAGIPASVSAATMTQEQIAQQINQLQQQLTKMEAQSGVNYKNWKVSLSNRIGAYSLAAEKGSGLPVASDMRGPFEEYPATLFGLTLLQAKSLFSPKTLAIGGYIEIDPQVWHVNGSIPGAESSPATGGGTYTTTVNLDFMGNINKWTTVFLGLKDGDLSKDPASAVYWTKGFVTIGNLQYSPLYLSVGKDYLPFGVFAGNGPWSAALPRAEFCSNETNSIVLGYAQQGLATSFTLLNNKFQHNLANFIYSAYYTKRQGDWKYSLGAGYLFDARGLDNGYGRAYLSSHGSGGGDAVLQEGGPVGVYNLNGHVGYKDVTLWGEYFQGVRSAIINNPNGATVVKKGENIGEVSTWYLALTYSPILWGDSTTFLASYSGTNNMEGIPVALSIDPNAGPVAKNGMMKEWVFSVQRAFRPNILVGLEYQNAETYGHRYANVGTIDFSVYF